MPFLPALAAVATVAGTAVAAGQKSQADNYNSQVMAGEQRVNVDEANAQANLTLRAGRQALGKQRAAFGSAAVGYGGSSEAALDQSAINQELDALNTRYRGTITGYGYGVQSQILKSEANQQETAGALLAGGQALKTVSPYFGTPGGGT
jgi:hypothetical protein